MNVITISREYGAGGYEVARALADALGWELLDRELLHQAAALEHLPDAELERLDEKAVSLADRLRLHPPHQKYLHGLREAAQRAAARGNAILVGRGTEQLLSDVPHVLSIRLMAPLEWRARRMAQREGWTQEQAAQRCTEEERTRGRFLRYFFGEAPFQPACYAFVANTGRMPLEDVVALVVAVVRGAAGSEPVVVPGKRRVLTLSRELGAQEPSLVPQLATRLRLRVYDRVLLEQEAQRLGLTAEELAQVDEQPIGRWQRFRPGSLSQRYVEALRNLVRELADCSDVLLVGRGGSGFLRDRPEAFHARLVATPGTGVRRVMVQRWLREGLARALMNQSEARRSAFYRALFEADWASPLQYHLTVAPEHLGQGAVEVLARAAERHWAR